MLLYVGKKIALTAKKDIEVYKLLITNDNDELVTTVLKTPVTLNSVMEPEGPECQFSDNINKQYIKGGVIYAFISYDEIQTSVDKSYYKDAKLVKAIIREGTRYFVEENFKIIAAEELYLTDEEVEGSLTSPDLEGVCRDYLEAVYKDEERFNKDGIGIGYLRLSDGSFVSPFDEFDKSKAIGIVSFFREDGTPVIVSLDESEMTWVDKPDINLTGLIDGTLSKNGRANTYVTPKADFKLPVLDYCKGYSTEGTNKGEWYLGSIGEMLEVIQNMCVINASMLLNGVGSRININKYWASTEVINCRSDVAYSCNALGGLVSPESTIKTCSVRPLYY